MTSFVSTALIVYLSLPGAQPQRSVRPIATRCQALPANIQIARELRPAAATLMAKSPTFRRQCAAIAAAPNVRVGVALATTTLGPTTRARADARRYDSGALIVEVPISAGSDYVELIAHELEHVTELVDGVDLRTLAADQPAVVRQRRDDGAFETARARAAGEAAAVEVYGQVDPTIAALGRTVVRAGRTVWSIVAWPRNARTWRDRRSKDPGRPRPAAPDRGIRPTT
jgi:hypothetical protein